MNGRITLSVLCIAGLLSASSVRAEVPHISWTSSPSVPGSTVLVAGGGFGEQTELWVARLSYQDGGKSGSASGRVKLLQRDEQCLKFVLTKTLSMGMYTIQINYGRWLDQPA